MSGTVFYSVETELTTGSWLSFYPVHPAGICSMSETATLVANTPGVSTNVL